MSILMNQEVENEIPHAANGIDFSLVHPSLDQKLWMIDRVTTGAEKVGKIAKRYNFNAKHLQMLVARKRQGKTINARSGRPRVLDEQSHSAITVAIENSTCSSIDTLKFHIKDEFQATFTRQYPLKAELLLQEEREVHISRRSIKRYISRLHPGAFRDAN
jgi:transposase